MNTIYELHAERGEAIFAVPYESMRPRRAVRIPDGAIVEALPLNGHRDAPPALPGLFQVAMGGGPATIHHVNLGLVAGYLRLAGVFSLPGVGIAAVYGAEAVPLGGPLATA